MEDVIKAVERMGKPLVEWEQRQLINLLFNLEDRIEELEKLCNEKSSSRDVGDKEL